MVPYNQLIRFGSFPFTVQVNTCGNFKTKAFLKVDITEGTHSISCFEINTFVNNTLAFLISNILIFYRGTRS